MLARLSSQHGQGLVEFAVVFPLIVFFLFAVFEVGLGLNRQATLQHAAREGARYAAVSDGTDCNLIRTQTSNQSQGLVPATAAGVSIDYTDIDGGGAGPGDAVDVTVHYTFQPAILRSILSLFGSGIADINMDVTGSSRIERTLLATC
jgi:Flp pilus assembly protein TadG